MTQHAPYCHDCNFPFKQMGACPVPGESILWAYLSLVPYIIPIIVFLLLLATRKLEPLKLLALLCSCYVIGDKIVKNIVRSTLDDK